VKESERERAVALDPAEAAWDAMRDGDDIAE
jgi:hypothetical protein